MKTKLFRILSISLLVILFLVLVTLVAGAIAKSNLAKKYPAPGQLVDMGGYKMHINCVGQGSPTVILEAGWSDFSLLWRTVQPEVAEFTRVCSYDRAGYGWSEPSPYPRTANSMVEELHTLLVNAEIQGPLVMVGHSMGGVLVRVYTHNYPEEVVGMVLVDSVQEEQFLRYPEAWAQANEAAFGQFRMLGVLNSSGILALMPGSIPNRGLPDDAFAQYQASLSTSRYFQTSLAEWESEEDGFAEVLTLQIESFEDMPLMVLRRGHPEPSSLISDTENQQIWEIWQEWHIEMAGLSSVGKLVVVEESGHHIQLDQPDLVIDAIRQVVDATH